MMGVRGAATLLLAGCALAGGIGCSGSKKITPENQTATVVARQTAVIGGQQTVTPNIPPLPTLTDPESIALVPQRGNIFDYTLSLPGDWKPTAESTNGLDVFDIPNLAVVDPVTKGPGRAGYVSVECGPPRAPAGTTEYTSMALARNAVATTNNGAGTTSIIGHADESTLREVQIGSLTGAMFESSITIPPLTGRIDQAYIATPTCAWHVAVSIFSPGDELPYFSLFDRIVQTFRPGAPA